MEQSKSLDPLAVPMRDAPAARQWPVRTILVGIVFALVLPGLLFCTVLIYRIATAERARSEQAVQAAVSRVADAMDREVGNLAAALVALSTTQALDDGNLPAFDRQARALARALDQAVVLGDASGQQLVNTRVPFGAALPRLLAEAAAEQARARRTTVVSGLFKGATSGTDSVVVMHPVLRGGEVRYLLAISLQPLFLSRLLEAQGLPPGWIATVADSGGRVIARTLSPDTYIGRQMEVGPRRPANERMLGVVDSLEGVRVLRATEWLRQADWRVEIAAPLHGIEAPLRGTIGLLGVTGTVALGMAVLLALRLATWISGPLQRLAEAGEQLGRGRAVRAVASGIAEVDAVSRALVQAHAAAARFTGELEGKVVARTGELERANQRLRDAMERSAAAEEQLRQAQKMEAVGQLTGGIAHDFNNLLTIVIGSLDLLRRRAEEGRQRRLLDNALEGATRAATLTARLLAFSRRQPLQPQAVDVNRLIAGMSDLLHRTLGETVQLETVLAGGVWQVHVDPNQLENALLNLAVNGRDALAAAGRSGGRLMIGTSNAALGAGSVDADVAPGEFVELAVSDSGAGMEPEVMGRVFEPFFTTKPPGQGTGLGLSQVHGFVKQSGGQVRIRTAPDEGTTVTIQLPRFDGPEVAVVAGEAAEDAGRLGRVVLVVEDDAGVRRLSCEVLRDLGCEVLEAEGATDAVRLLDAHPEIEVLLTDVVLPGVSGVTLAEQARERRPGLPVLYASGFTGGMAANAQLPPGAVLLQKPFDVQAVAAKLKVVLGE